MTPGRCSFCGSSPSEPPFPLATKWDANRAFSGAWIVVPSIFMIYDMGAEIATALAHAPVPVPSHLKAQ